MSCLLNQIIRVAQTNHFHPILYKIMLNAFPNNNSLLKNTSTSFYTILTSNIYKNHNLAKQKQILKSSARLESNNDSNKQVKKPNNCKPKKKTPKIKYTEIRICQSSDKRKEKMICICMPISKFKEMRSKTKLSEAEIVEFTKQCSPEAPLCWVPPLKKSVPVQTWTIDGPTKTCRIPCLSHKTNKSSTIDQKSSQSAYLMKSRSSTNYRAPSNQPSPNNYCTSPKQPSPTNFYASPKQSSSSSANCSPSKQPKSTNICTSLKQGSTNGCALPKQPNIKPK